MNQDFLSENRSKVINALICLSKDLDELSDELKLFKWDYDGVAFELTRKHIADALSRYVVGSLTSGDIERWANMIEGREDIVFEEAYKSIIENVIYELANPILTEALNFSRARQLVIMLSSKEALGA